MCEREPKISSDRYIVAVKNEGTIVEHLPQKLYKIFREINFRSLMRIRKFFNNENFPIYGIMFSTTSPMYIWSAATVWR